MHEVLFEIKEKYNNDRFIFISGEVMEGILRKMGATDEDFYGLKTVSNNLSPDPTLPFRESKNGRFELNFLTSTINRIEFQPFVLSAQEDFVRHDSGKVRRFRGIGDDLQLNRAFQGLLIFKAFIVHGIDIRHRSGLDYDSERWVSTVFNLRTITTPDLIGEPALEGVHADGVDHTMTTLLGMENMTDDSAITSIHDNREINGTRWDAADPDWQLGQAQHKRFLDTMLIVDHERKHSLSPVQAAAKERRATRDMLIFFTRHPAVAGHVSHPYDSFEPHREIPLSIESFQYLRPLKERWKSMNKTRQPAIS